MIEKVISGILVVSGITIATYGKILNPTGTIFEGFIGFGFILFACGVALITVYSIR